VAIHNDFGKKGEALAKSYLESKGYEILDENWCFRKAEVDIIAYKHKPEDFVNEKKQILFSKAAEEYVYIMSHKGEIRFDIIAILFDDNFENYTLKHIEDAFWNYS
jgi:putative endonuclease